jgi:hypothetical protein
MLKSKVENKLIKSNINAFKEFVDKERSITLLDVDHALHCGIWQGSVG